MKSFSKVILFFLLIMLPLEIDAATNQVIISANNEYRYIDSNGIPDHQTGQFPNRNNPNRIAEQYHSFRVSLYPKRQNQPTPNKHNIFGVALNGVPFDPATAEYYNNQHGSEWNYEALSGAINLGLDQHNAHVQPNGSYHYHGIPKVLTTEGDMIGYAADGFPIYVIDSLRASYRLKSGTRPSGPGGRYDGTFVNDFEYVPGIGDLDECNGIEMNTHEYPQGTYLYVLTDHFPFIPRCWSGIPDESFMKRGRAAGNRGQRNRRQGENQRERRQPPSEAIDACRGQSPQASCSIQTPQGKLNGSCENLGGQIACRPHNHRR